MIQLFVFILISSPHCNNVIVILLHVNSTKTHSLPIQRQKKHRNDLAEFNSEADNTWLSLFSGQSRKHVKTQKQR